MTMKTLPTPSLDEVLANVRHAVNQIKPAVRKDMQAALAAAKTVNVQDALQAQPTPRGSAARQKVFADNDVIQAAEEALRNDSAFSDQQFAELLDRLNVIAARLTDRPKQPEPVSPDDIAKQVLEGLKPQLAPPTSAPVPDPVDLKALAKDTADAAVAGVKEQFMPLFATDPDGKPTKAASEASVTALAGRVNDLERANVILGLVVDDQGNHVPGPGTYADYTRTAIRATNTVVWVPMAIILGVTFVIALVVGFLTVLGPTYALWITVLGFLIAASTFGYNNRNRNRFSR